jgi:hypothetical protein
MKKIIKTLLFAYIFIFLNSSIMLSQQENVPIDHPVYIFLKEMSVKNILADIHDDNPIMSRAEVKNYLDDINSKVNDLSATEKNILKKYQDEFYDDKAAKENTYQMFGVEPGFSNSASDILSQKIKYALAYRDTGATFYLNILGRFVHGQNINPQAQNTELFDIGFRFRGTLFDKLGYSLSVIKGGIKGSGAFAATIDPRMNYNFHYVENKENIGNYDFTEGYLRYFIEPVKKMKLSLEIGREKMTFGYGYGSKLVLSGDHPVLDFVKLDFNYGVFSFSSWMASTVGAFDTARSNDYTKYIATNRFKLSFKNLFDFGLGESVVYSGRGIDLAYLNPLAFYKFEEMSLQDRDNGTLWLDLQTHFIKNLELQATFFLDDNPLGNLQELSNFINKTGYQLGAFWYSPFSINDLSLVFEYTRIRPYVYSHDNPKENYTAWGQVMGHRIGPNSDEILLRAAYNFNDWIRLNLEYQYVRHGNNVYDAQGNLIFNAGGDALVGHRLSDPIIIQFLSGERINTNVFTFDLRLEPVRQFVFNIVYNGIIKKNITRDISENSSYGYLKLMFEL